VTIVSKSKDGAARDGSPDSPIATAFRFVTELVAWVATPWALWSVSPWSAVVAVVLLIGVPAVFTTPGDRPPSQVRVPGTVTIAILAAELAAAAISVWFVWPTPIDVLVLLLVAGTVITSVPRIRWLWNAPGREISPPA
jgi:hypothetical protein